MTGKPTLQTVAREAGVSIPTVSQVLRGTGRISETTRQRVMEAAARLRYVQDSRAAAMRSGENREIGFVINQLQNPFNAEVISGVVDTLEAEGYLVSVVDTRDNPDRQVQQMRTFIQHGRGGLLWVPALGHADEIIDLLEAQRIPAVTFMRHQGARLDHVGIRNFDATATATRHLLSLGHRHFAYLGGTEQTTVRLDRIKGFQQMLAQAGAPQGVIWPCRDNKLAGLAELQALQSAHPQITAIVCNGDMVALGACMALLRQGMQPGREMSIIGFDDIQDAAVATPALTTMSVHPYALGETLARTLLRRITDPTLPVTRQELPADLVIRATTGPV